MHSNSATRAEHRIPINITNSNIIQHEQLNSNSFTTRQLMQIFNEIIQICSKYHTKQDQLLALTAIYEKHVLND